MRISKLLRIIELKIWRIAKNESNRRNHCKNRRVGGISAECTLERLWQEPFPFSDDEVYTAVSTVVAVAASLAAWWKNNSFTTAALKADETLALERTETAESEAVSHE